MTVDDIHCLSWLCPTHLMTMNKGRNMLNYNAMMIIKGDEGIKYDNMTISIWLLMTIGGMGVS